MIDISGEISHPLTQEKSRSPFWPNLLAVYKAHSRKLTGITMAGLAALEAACSGQVPQIPSQDQIAHAAETVQARVNTTVVPKIQYDATRVAESSDKAVTDMTEFIDETGQTVPIITSEIQEQLNKVFEKASQGTKERLNKFNSLSSEEKMRRFDQNTKIIANKLVKTPLSNNQTIEDGGGEIIDTVIAINQADLSPEERITAIGKFLPLIAQANDPSMKLSVFLCYAPVAKEFRVQMFEFGRPDDFSAENTCINIERNLRAKEFQAHQELKKIVIPKTPLPTAK